MSNQVEIKGEFVMKDDIKEMEKVVRQLMIEDHRKMIAAFDRGDVQELGSLIAKQFIEHFVSYFTSIQLGEPQIDAEEVAKQFSSLLGEDLIREIRRVLRDSVERNDERN